MQISSYRASFRQDQESLLNCRINKPGEKKICHFIFSGLNLILFVSWPGSQPYNVIRQ